MNLNHFYISIRLRYENISGLNWCHRFGFSAPQLKNSSYYRLRPDQFSKIAILRIK